MDILASYEPKINIGIWTQYEDQAYMEKIEKVSLINRCQVCYNMVASDTKQHRVFNLKSLVWWKLIDKGTEAQR